MNALPEGVKVLSVGEVTRAIKGLLEDAFPSVWVSGEISNYRPASSGHVSSSSNSSGRRRSGNGP